MKARLGLSNIKALYADRPPEKIHQSPCEEAPCSLCPPWLMFRLASFPEPKPTMLPPLVGEQVAEPVRNQVRE